MRELRENHKNPDTAHDNRPPGDIETATPDLSRHKRTI